jgi:hypothetical protein
MEFMDLAGGQILKNSLIGRETLLFFGQNSWPQRAAWPFASPRAPLRPSLPGLFSSPLIEPA